MNGLGIWRDSLSQVGFEGKVVLCGDILLGSSPTICLHTESLPHTIPKLHTTLPKHSPHQSQCRCFPKKPRGVQRGRATSTLRFWFFTKRKEDIRRCLTSHLLLFEVVQQFNEFFSIVCPGGPAVSVGILLLSEPFDVWGAASLDHVEAGVYAVLVQCLVAGVGL